METGAYMQYGLFEKLGWGPSPNGVKDRTPMLDRSTIQGSTTAVQVRNGNFTMKRLQVIPLLLGLFFAFTAGVVNAQTVGGDVAAPLTREQVKKERDDFFKTHKYDAATENWVLRPGFEPPSGTKSRDEVKAELDEFLKTHKYDQPTETWVPVKGTPRDVSKMTRAQVRAETKQFYRTHDWDEVSSTWVEKKASPRTKK
jgi:hypothetical protein